MAAKSVRLTLTQAEAAALWSLANVAFCGDEDDLAAVLSGKRSMDAGARAFEKLGTARREALRPARPRMASA